MMSSRDPSEEATSLPRKQEGLCANEDASKSISRTSLASSTPWFRLKDPRIVRVSRALGGKDRHSKVCTIRGLRDRRVRLSVPTAIQLYDLQDRLGLRQPSKVVDWLMDAAKHEIDELPPLPLQPFHFGQPPMFHHYASSQSMLPSSLEIDQSSNRDQLGLTSSMNWDGADNSSKLSRRKLSNNLDDASHNREEKQELSGGKVAEELVQPRATDNPNNFPYGSNICHLEPSSSPNNFPYHGLITSQGSSEDARDFNFVQTPSALPLSQTHPYFPLQFITPSGAEMDPQHVSQLQSMVMSSGLQNFLSGSHEQHPISLTHQSFVRAPVISFDVNARVAPSHSGSGNEMDEE